MGFLGLTLHRLLFLGLILKTITLFIFHLPGFLSLLLSLLESISGLIKLLADLSKLLLGIFIICLSFCCFFGGLFQSLLSLI